MIFVEYNLHNTMQLTTHRQPVKQPSQIDWAMAAAYLDSEGSIIITMNKHKDMT